MCNPVYDWLCLWIASCYKPKAMFPPPSEAVSINSSAVRGSPFEPLLHLWLADARFPFLSYTVCLSVHLTIRPSLRLSVSCVSVCHFFCVWVCTWVCTFCVWAWVWRPRTTCRSWFSASFYRGGFQRLCAFTCWAVLLASRPTQVSVQQVWVCDWA